MGKKDVVDTTRIEILAELGRYSEKVSDMAHTIDTLYENNLRLMTKIERLNRKFGEGKVRDAVQELDKIDEENRLMRLYISLLPIAVRDKLVSFDDWKKTEFNKEKNV